MPMQSERRIAAEGQRDLEQSIQLLDCPRESAHDSHRTRDVCTHRAEQITRESGHYDPSSTYHRR